MTQSAFLNMTTRLTLIYAAAFCAANLFIAFITEGIVVTERGIVGGDFLAFYTAGEFMRLGDALSAYDFYAFDAQLKERAPLERLGMMWQYPPTMFFITAPFSFLPYKIGYIAWMTAGWTALFLALRHIGFRGQPLLLLGFSAVCVNVVDNGQISMATAALLFLAAYQPKKRWLVAGVAAGLLTIKPQLGLLLPIAFLMCGAWRTIAVASATAIILHAPSLLVFGVEGWREFFSAVARLNADVVGLGLNTPPTDMTTLFGQLRVFGAPSSIAVPAQYAFACLIAIVVALVWRRSDDALGKAALLCAGAILVTPYAYAYEMTALLLPAAFIARECQSYRSPASLYLVAAAVIVALTPVLPTPFGLQWAFVVSVSAFAVVLSLVARPLLAGSAAKRLAQAGSPASLR